MKIRTRLTVLFTVLTAGILALICFSIYHIYADYREEEYFRQLKKQALNKVNLLLDAKVAPDVLQLIFKNSPNSLFQEEVAVYDTAFDLIYHDAVEVDFVKETREMFEEIRAKEEIRFLQEDRQVVGFLFRDRGNEFVITAASYDEHGLSKVRILRYILVGTFLISILLISAAGRFFSKQALVPISRVVKQVEAITASSLNLRVDPGNGKDEIAELAITFNRMLGRLEDSFESQKNFVSNISHEIRTPLAAIIAELEIAGSKERNVEEYRKMISSVLNDAQRLVKLSNNLLDLAKAGYDPSGIKFKRVRLDELLLDAKQDVHKANPQYKIRIDYESGFEDADFVSIIGNEHLLKVAFTNLMDNGCKFSENHRSTVSIDSMGERITLRFADSGVGIAGDEQAQLFTPFFRGANKNRVAGNGIGLYLTGKVIALHRGRISVTSKPGQGSIFTVELPRA